MANFQHDDDATLYFSSDDPDPLFEGVADGVSDDEILGDSVEGCPESFLEGYEEDLL
jgi:hypothetical protein